MGSQELDHPTGDLRWIAGPWPPAIPGCWVHAGNKVEMDETAAELVDRLVMHDMRGHQEDRGAISHRSQARVPEEIEQEQALDRPLGSNDKPLLQPGRAPEPV